MAKDFGIKKIYKSLNDPILNIQDFDFCYESAGKAETISKGFKLLNKNGKLFFCSHPKKGDSIKIDPHKLIEGRKIEGSWGGGVKNKKSFENIISQVKVYKKYLNKLSNKHYSLKHINQAIKDMETGKNIRPIIKI